MGEKFIFPTTENIKIGRITYRVSAFFDVNHEELKPKIEKLLRREIESGNYEKDTQSDTS